MQDFGKKIGVFEVYLGPEKQLKSVVRHHENSGFWGYPGIEYGKKSSYIACIWSRIARKSESLAKIPIRNYGKTP